MRKLYESIHSVAYSSPMKTEVAFVSGCIHFRGLPCCTNTRIQRLQDYGVLLT
jgi:hypothetical protein